MSEEPYAAFSSVSVPKILGFEESVADLVRSGMSVCRFGDGEFGCLNGGIPFQRRSDSLGTALKRILKEDSATCRVALAKPHFYRMEDVRPHVVRFAEQWSRKAVERSYLEWVDCSRTYLDTSLTIPYHHYLREDSFWRGYFTELGGLVAGKEVLLVTGDPSLVGSGCSFFTEFARRVTVIQVPSRDCWVARNDIIPQLRAARTDGDICVVFCCGPAWTVWAWELSREMTCYDFGHLSREYDFWKCGKDPSQNQREFFAT